MQIQLLSDNFGLQFNPAIASDTAEYFCLVNDRHIPEAIVDLLVQGECYKYEDENLENPKKEIIWKVELH